jgi:hypothetical protein
MLSWPRSLVIVPLLLLLSANTVAKARTRTISLAQAKAKALALHPGEIRSVELEKEHGRQIYSFDIKTKDGIHEVNVDSETRLERVPFRRGKGRCGKKGTQVSTRSAIP